MKNSLRILMLFGYCSFSLFSSEILTDQKEHNSNVPYIVLLYGPPGSGRSKIAVKIHQEFNIPHIAIAELILQYAQENSTLGNELKAYLEQGGDISDSQCIALFKKRLKEADCSRGCLIEGAPWSLSHAEALYNDLKDSFSILAINIDTDDNWLMTQVEKRLICPTCGRVYHEPFSLPKTPGICDICSKQLVRRQDDSPEAMRAKLDAYRNSIVPILSFFKEKNCFILIEGDRTQDAIFSLVSNSLLEKHIGTRTEVSF